MQKKRFAVLIPVCLLLFLAAETDVLGQGLPTGYFTIDVGNVGQPGSASFDGGVFTVSGSGADMWDTADAFRLVYHQATANNAEMVARVTSIQNTDPFAKAGVTFRQNLGADSPHVVLDVRPGGELEFMTRPPGGGETRFIAGATVTLPVFLKLRRIGGSVTGSYSTDGATWTTLGEAPQLIGGTVPGLVVCSHDNSVLNTSTFDNVVFTNLPLPDGWLSKDIGNVGLAGDASNSGVVWSVRGVGDDIWGTADAFQFAFREPTGDTSVFARVNSESNTDDFAKAGIMMRSAEAGFDTPAADEAHVILDVRPNGQIEFMTRPTRGAETTFLGGATVRFFPVYLQLQRKGDQITASMSSDGVTWTVVGTTSLQLTERFAAGMAVTSHNLNAVNSAAFQNVEVSWQEGALPPPDDIVFYASDIIEQHGVHGPDWLAIISVQSPGQLKLVLPDHGAPLIDPPRASPTNYLEVTFSTSETRQYHLWLRMLAESDSKFNDSVWVQVSDATVDGAQVYPIGTDEGLLINLEDCFGCGLSNWGFQDNAWWLDQPVILTLSAGQHTVRIQPREDGVEIDEMVLSPARYLHDPPGPTRNATTFVSRP